METAKSAPTVLYVHGLESGPNGRKVKLLRKACGSDDAVACVQMPVKELLSWRRNRHFQLAAALVAAACATLAAVALQRYARLSTPFASRAHAGEAFCMLLAIVMVAALVKRLIERGVRECVRVCVEQQRTLLAVMPSVRVVVGSSFGGAIVAELQHSGDWKGATILICPAVFKVSAYAGTEPRTLCELPKSVQRRTLIVHGDADNVVPLMQSRALGLGSKARLEVVESGDHRLVSLRAKDFERYLSAVLSVQEEEDDDDDDDDEEADDDDIDPADNDGGE